MAPNKQSRSADSKDNQNNDAPLTTTQFLSLIKTNEYRETIEEINKPIVDLLTKEIQILKGVLHKQNSEIQECHRLIYQQDKRIKKLEDLIHIKERNTRLKNLKVTGLTGPSVEDYKTQFIELVDSNLKIKLTKDDFDVKAPPPPDPTPAEAAAQSKTQSVNQNNGSKKPVNVMFTFINDWTRRMIYTKRVHIGRNIFLSEDLTRDESSLYYHCRMAKREKKIKSTWTMNHKVFILTFMDEKVEIPNKELLDLVVGGQWDRRDQSFGLFNDSVGGSNPFLGFSPSEVSSPARRGPPQLYEVPSQESSLMESFISTSSVNN